MSHRLLVITLFVISMMIITACTSTQVEGKSLNEVGQDIVTENGTYTEISVNDLKALQQGQDDFLLVNTHIPFEGDIPQTDTSIAFNEVEQHVDQLPTDKDAPIILYCRSDSMSTMAAETLVGLGFTNIYNVDGGMVAWEQAGYQLER